MELFAHDPPKGDVTAAVIVDLLTCCFTLPSTRQVAVPDLVDAAGDADILVFVIPHQFIGRVCDTIKGKIKSDALGMSLIKVRTARYQCDDDDDDPAVRGHSDCVSLEL